MAHFGQALKAPKAPQQLSKPLAPRNPPLALPSYLPVGPTNCFYWASYSCYMARFGQALKLPKAPQQLSKALAPHNRPLALPSYLPRGPTNCFCWASKLLHGTFWAGLKTSKSPAAAFDGLLSIYLSVCLSS